MNPKPQRGFTLWELLMTLAVAGILVGLGVPNVMEFQRNGAMTAAANELVTGVLMARAEAVKRQVPVTLCLSDNPLDASPTCSPDDVTDSDTRGFVVFVDENGNVDANGSPILTDGTDGNAEIDAGEVVLMQSAARGGTLLVSANCGYLSYGTSGWLRQAPGLCFPANPAVLYCDDRGRRASSGTVSSARAVRIDRPGRGQVMQSVADVNAAVAVLSADGVSPTCPP